ncbi:MAG: diguanylate cyclase [Acidimicrobiales bacterium]|nr:diguanylate cyclase [Acidimicrobiales bacterium]
MRRTRYLIVVLLPALLWSQGTTSIPGPLAPPLPLGIMLGGMLLFVNLIDPSRNPQVPLSSIKFRIVLETAADTAIIFVAIWCVGLDPSSGLWMLLLFPIFEAVARFSVLRAALISIAIALLHVISEIWFSIRYVELNLDSAGLAHEVALLLLVAVGARVLLSEGNEYSDWAPTRAGAAIKLKKRKGERRLPPTGGLAVLYIDLEFEKELPKTVKLTLVREVIARRISSCIRTEDSVLGCDKDAFAVLLPGVRDVDGAVIVGERILDKFGDPIAVAGHLISINLRVGAAYSAHPVDEPDDLIGSAGREVILAKRRGGSSLVIHEPEPMLVVAVN